MKNIVFLLEEESAKIFIDNLLPRIYKNISFLCISFEGKQDLEKNIPIKLNGYRVPNTEFVILRDEDSGDCKKIKDHLQNLSFNTTNPNPLIRIACKEIESWYFGDLNSVENALSIPNLTKYSAYKKYRIPDNIVNPKKELRKITNGIYQQISSSREIAKHIDIERNTSHSFNVFLNGIKRIIED